MAQDYILRLIEQVALMLAQISALRKTGHNAEAVERIAAICLQTIGLPFDAVRRAAPETILDLLERGGATRHTRAVLLAELLLQDAELSEAAGKDREAAIGRAQARALLAQSIDFLPPDEQAVYRRKLEALTSDPECGGP